MSTLTLAISSLTTSNLPWFMDLRFQVPMQYCSLQHGTLLLSPVTTTTGYCFHFGSIPSFFLELFLYCCPLAYWAPPTDLGSSSFSILSICLFLLFMGFSRQEYWSGLQFPSPVDLILSDLSTMTHRFGWPHTAWLSVTELDTAVVQWVSESVLLPGKSYGWRSLVATVHGVAKSWIWLSDFTDSLTHPAYKLNK